MAGTVTYGQSIMGGNAYITSDGNEYSSQSAAQAHQSQLNTPATPASPATSASITTPSVPTVSQKTGSSAISGGANPAQYSYNTPTQTSTAAPSSSSSLYYYKDTSGQQHVVSDLATAQAYAAPGSAIYNFTGAASGGYGSGDIGSQVSTGTGAGYTGGANTAMIGGSSAAHITDYMSTLGGSATYNSSTGMVQITSPNGKSVSVSPSSIPGTANVGGYLYVSDPTAFNNYLATATGYNASVATAQNKITSQLAQVLDTLLPTINAQLTAPTTTTAPTASEYQPITWDQAMSQAQQIVNPATAAAQQQLTDTYQQNLSQLPYTLAGRGELQSGLLGGGTAGLTQAQASALSQLASQQSSNTATLANQIQSGSQTWTAEELQNAYDTWANQYNQQMDLYNTQVSQQEAARQQALTTLASLLSTMYGGETSASANAVTAIQNMLQSMGATPAA